MTATRRPAHNGGATVCCAVFGDPVSHSLSPAMHRAAFRATGIPYVYLKFRVPAPALRAALQAARVLGFRGVNLTIPLKERGRRIIRRLTPSARRAGAVNTVTFTARGMEGHSTDGEGFLRSLREAWGSGVTGRRVVVIGAGGAARSVGFALADGRVRSLVFVNRTAGRARRLAADVSRRTPVRASWRPLNRETDWPRLLAASDLLVNATSMGMGGTGTPVPLSALRPPLQVADLVYVPSPTPLVRAARARGLEAVDGTGMLVHQGALAFERWTGRRAPVRAMRRALSRAIARLR